MKVETTNERPVGRINLVISFYKENSFFFDSGPPHATSTSHHALYSIINQRLAGEAERRACRILYIIKPRAGQVHPVNQ